MKQLYYTIQTLLRGRGSNIIKVISLTLGLLVRNFAVCSCCIRVEL